MSKRPITSRQVIAQVVGPNGPVDCGKWESGKCTHKMDVVDYKPTDGTTQHLVEGYDYSGSLSRGVFDARLAALIWNQMHCGTSDPPRLMLLFSHVLNEDPTVVYVAKEVLITNLDVGWQRGQPVKEDLTFVAEELEIV